MNANTPEERPACPTWDTLVGFHNGALPVMDLEVVAGHLSGCTRCERALIDLDTSGPVDDALALLQQWQEWPSVLNEPGWARMQAGAEAILSANSTVAEAARTEETRRWLGQTVGHYEIVDKLGRGGMGVVYKARQQPLGRLVALKMILAGIHATADQRTRFVTEGRAAARLEHPNIVGVYDFDEHEGLPFYTMELVPGESLADRLKRGPLEPRAAAELVRRLAEAVTYAHQNKVVHRDLKPANVLFAADSGPKITDFGLAKLLDSEDLTLTQTDMVIGTAPYMAPEQAEARQADVGPAADVWALGVILYECLTGRVPFRGADRFETMQLVRRAEPAAPSRLRRGIPRDLDTVCLTCLRKAPAERYPSAAALAADLDRWLNGQRLVGTPPWPRRLWWGLRRAGRVLTRPAVAVGLVAAMLVSTLAYFGRNLLEGPTADPALKQAERDREGGEAVSEAVRAAAANLNAIERKLEAGEEVMLIGDKGEPAWYRWRAGELMSGTSLAEADGTFVVQSQLLALVDLLPDPRHASYRLSAEVRHTQSRLGGHVGLFFACQSYARRPADAQFLTQLTFNDVRSVTEGIRLPDGSAPKPRDNWVDMGLYLHSRLEHEPSLSMGFGGTAGPRFKPAGPGNTGWRSLEVTVTPERVTASWDGKPPWSQTTVKIRQDIRRRMDDFRTDGGKDPVLQAGDPTFNPRGALGLYVQSSAASFRNVTVTPIVEKP